MVEANPDLVIIESPRPVWADLRRHLIAVLAAVVLAVILGIVFRSLLVGLATFVGGYFLTAIVLAVTERVEEREDPVYATGDIRAFIQQHEERPVMTHALRPEPLAAFLRRSGFAGKTVWRRNSADGLNVEPITERFEPAELRDYLARVEPEMPKDHRRASGIMTQSQRWYAKGHLNPAAPFVGFLGFVVLVAVSIWHGGGIQGAWSQLQWMIPYLIVFGIMSLAIRSPLIKTQLIVLNGGVARRSYSPWSTRQTVRLFDRRKCVLVVERGNSDSPALRAEIADQSDDCAITFEHPLHVQAFLRAWLSPVEPPSLELLKAALAG